MADTSHPRQLQRIREQEEAKRLLGAALHDAPVHAYLFHGPAGVGKRRAALAFAGELLGDAERVERLAHPDLYLLEPLGDQIRIDDIRLLHHDLHMRPFEADRRIYLILGADVLNDDAADALLKDLEEPPSYAVLILVADDLGPLPETIRSRCQLVPFTRLSERAVREEIAERAPDLPPEELRALARVAGGRLDRAARLLDERAAARRSTVLEIVRATYGEPPIDPGEATTRVLAGVEQCAEDARAVAEAALEPLDLPTREAEQRVRRAMRGAERDELLLTLEELSAWYRDLVVVASGADEAAVHYDRLEELRADATPERAAAAEEAAEIVRETWRSFEEFNVQPGLALEALFVRLRRAFADARSWVAA